MFFILLSHAQLIFEPKKLTEEEMLEKSKQPLGSKANPVRCQGPKGEREYLNRLRCSNGHKPEFLRSGSYGPGPYGTFIDGYEVKCEKSDQKTTIFMDMYHVGYYENRPVPGFDIIPTDVED
jgi:hypothetical protein